MISRALEARLATLEARRISRMRSPEAHAARIAAADAAVDAAVEQAAQTGIVLASLDRRMTLSTTHQAEVIAAAMDAPALVQWRKP